MVDQRKQEKIWRQLIHSKEPDYEKNEQQLLFGDKYKSRFELADQHHLHSIWRSVVESYTACDLSKGRDMLMAISGVAKRMQEAFGGERYVAGLWESRLIDQLAWRVIRLRSPPRDDVGYRGPSWAWPSVNAVVHVVDRHRLDHTFSMTEVQDGLQLVLQNPNTENKTTTLLFASLTVEAEVYQLSFTRSSRDSLTWILSRDKIDHPVDCVLHLDRPFDVEDKQTRSDTELRPASDQKLVPEALPFCAAMLFYDTAGFQRQSRMYSGFLLALRRVQVSEASVFNRIGLIQFNNVSEAAWTTLQTLRTKREGWKKDDDLAPSDDRGEFSHILTLL
jgi:uncharacterized protein YueI